MFDGIYKDFLFFDPLMNRKFMIFSEKKAFKFDPSFNGYQNLPVFGLVTAFENNKTRFLTQKVAKFVKY